MDNNEPHTLARIPLRWMIRECYKLNTGIIFDAHMLKYEVGMDVDSLQAPFKPPTQVLPQGQSLKLPGSGEKQGFTLSRSIPVAIYSGITLPFRWSWNKVTHLRYHKIVPPPPPRDDTQFKGEGHEELEDALCPIYDQLHLHWYWKVMEYIPCELPTCLVPPSVNELIRGASRDHQKAERRDSRFGRGMGLQVDVSFLLLPHITASEQRD